MAAAGRACHEPQTELGARKRRRGSLGSFLQLEGERENNRESEMGGLLALPACKYALAQWHYCLCLLGTTGRADRHARS